MLAIVEQYEKRFEKEKDFENPLTYIAVLGRKKLEEMVTIALAENKMLVFRYNGKQLNWKFITIKNLNNGKEI